MEPVNNTAAGVGDLLERILEKGVVIRLDLIISVADIPLIGLGAQLAVASIETMNAYGVLGGWGGEIESSGSAESGRVATRELEAVPRAVLTFAPGEHEVLDEFASWRVDEGWATWRPCRLHVTNRRFALTRTMPAEVMLEVDLDSIRGIGRGSAGFAGVVADVVHLELANGRLVVLRASRSGLVAASIRDVLRRKGREARELRVDGGEDHGGSEESRW